MKGSGIPETRASFWYFEFQTAGKLEKKWLL